MAMLRSINAVLLILLLCATALCDYPDVEKMDQEEFLGDSNVSGKIAAFGDVNSDKQTDVFVISDNGTSIYVLIGSRLPPALSSWDEVKLEKASTSVALADFDGDGCLDLLVTSVGLPDQIEYSVAIYWGNADGKFDSENVSMPNETFFDEPLVLDANADMIADLFVIYSNQSRGFLIGQQEKRVFVVEPFTTAVKGLKMNDPYKPHSHAFIDLTSDGSANLFVTAENKTPVYEVWKGSEKGLILQRTINTSHPLFADKDLQIGHVAFADFTGNAKEDIAVATCVLDGSNGCKKNRILIYSDDDWHIFSELPDKWSFPFLGGSENFPTTLRVADFNLDSYPDVMTIVQDNEDGKRKAAILYNDACKSCTAFGRQLGNTSLELPGSEDTVLATFYDFNMDGTIDIITTKADSDGHYKLTAYKNMIADDVTFLRVQVLTDSEEPNYGVNVPGPHITYQTTNTEGGSQRGCLGQLSQSAHFSLQLPYVMFGLGRLANFVDSITVSVPVNLIVTAKRRALDKTSGGSRNSTAGADAFNPLKKPWPMLIPNSQLYVIPHPRDTPSRWTNKLLVTPSQNITMTAVVLLATCGALALATLVLHWFEKREDKQEKIQEAYRFHFDAM